MHPQGVNSSTFSPPPLDGSLTFPQLLEHQLVNSPNHIAYIYDDSEGHTVSVSVAQYVTAVHATCRLVVRDVRPISAGGGTKEIIVGIFAVADTISYCMLVAAIMRAGMVPFCISPRLQPKVIAKLLLDIDVAAVYVSSDTQSQITIAEAFGLCAKSAPVFQPPAFAALQGDEHSLPDALSLPPIRPAALDSTAIILHSSGSTSFFSKPVLRSHKMVLRLAALPWSGMQDHCGQILGAHMIFPAHGLGLLIGLLPFSSGLTVAILRPTTPPMQQTAKNGMNGILATKPDLVLAAPAFIKIWSEEPLGLKAMQSLKCLSYAGAPLEKRVGDFLVSKGVVLCPCYGALEVGPITPFFTSHGKAWDYFSVQSECTVVRVPEKDTSGLYTHIYLGGPMWPICYTNTVIGGRQGYAVSDLLEQHPENPQLHRFYERKDDIIVFSSSAKMNPTAAEAQISRNPLVDTALIFGAGKPYPGIIIQVKPEFQQDLLDAEKKARILDALRVSVEAQNSMGSARTRISEAMMILADPRRPFALTSKGDPRRKAVLEDYAEEIAAAYL